MGNSSATPGEIIHRYLEHFPDSNLANVLADQQQRKKLTMAADDILSNFLDPKVSNCYIVRDFFREIFAGAVLEPTVSSMSRPDYINSWIVYLLREGEPEIMSAIDAGVEGAARNQGVALPNTHSDTTAVPPASEGSDAPPLSKSGKDENKHGDRATEDAVLETRRLSSMMAAKDTPKQDPVQKLGSNNGESVESPNSDAITVPSASDNGVTEKAVSGGARNGHNARTETSSGSILEENAGHSPNTEQTSIRSNSTDANSESPATPQPPPLTLHLASVSLDDGSGPGDKTLFRARPVEEYLIQIEPVLSHRSGWMVFRKYADFESLHETLSIVSRINKIRSFSEDHPDLPPWRGQTKYALARELERYLQDALQHESLAESMRMRRFLEKDERLKSASALSTQNAFENVGKSVLGALSNAPKGMAGGSKAVFDGVTGVFGGGGVAGKKAPGQGTVGSINPDETHSIRDESTHSRSSDLQSDATSLEVDNAAMERLSVSSNGFRNGSVSHSARSSVYSGDVTPDTAPNQNSGDCESRSLDAQTGQDTKHSDMATEDNQPSDMMENGGEKKSDSLPAPSDVEPEVSSARTSDVERRRNSPITNEETQMAVELIFAVINELYTSSSAWNIRRTILNAAKSYILRPGSPNLETIRTLMQSSMIDAHTSDEALGGYLMNLHDTVFPPPDYEYSLPSETEKERLRETARRLFVQKGMPQAVMSVMGAAASRETMEKVFDCLQVESVARGFVFSVFLQALKVVFL